MNRLARKMDEACDGVHPSAWAELTARDRARYVALAKVGPR